MKQYSFNQKFIKASFFLLTASIISSINDIISKHINLCSTDLMFFRALLGCIILIPLIIKNQEKTNIFEKHHIMRGALFGLGMLCYLTALKNMQLATIIAINFSTPLWVTVFASIFLKEKVKHSIYLNILGVIGIIIISYTSFSSTNYQFVLLALIGAIIFAMLDIINKYLINKNESMMQMLIGSNFWITMFLSPFFSYNMHHTIPTWILLIALAAGSNLLLYFILKAWQNFNITALQPIKYIEFPIAVYFGTNLFKEQTSIMVIIGFMLLAIAVTINLYNQLMNKSNN